MTDADARSQWVKRPAAATEGTNCPLEEYQALYARSIEDSDAFWAGQAQRLDWITPPSQSEFMHEQLPNSELVIFEESAHWVYIEEEELFLNTVNDWLSRT